MARFVVDASVCAKWFFDEEHGARALSLLGSDAWLLAPDLLVSELGNIVWKKHARGEITAATGAEALSALRDTDIDLVPAAELSVEALAIAVTLRHPFYDCLYLALAARERAAVVTADRRLCQKVGRTSYADLALWIGDLP